MSKKSAMLRHKNEGDERRSGEKKLLKKRWISHFYVVTWLIFIQLSSIQSICLRSENHVSTMKSEEEKRLQILDQFTAALYASLKVMYYSVITVAAHP